jgi:hypothetical protein
MDDILLTEFPLMYRIEGSSVIKYRVLKETDVNYVVIPDGLQFMAKKSQFYNKKTDAYYNLLIKRLSKGIPFSNYKTSKYYNEYKARLLEEHPEFLI